MKNCVPYTDWSDDWSDDWPDGLRLTSQQELVRPGTVGPVQETGQTGTTAEAGLAGQ